MGMLRLEPVLVQPGLQRMCLIVLSAGQVPRSAAANAQIEMTRVLALLNLAAKCLEQNRRLLSLGLIGEMLRAPTGQLILHRDRARRRCVVVPVQSFKASAVQPRFPLIAQAV